MPFLLLPFFEIIGFIVIGGKIGLLDSLLWMLVATIGGFYLLQAGGFRTLRRAQNNTNEDFFNAQDLFDDLCLVIAALLLIFPGFVSDFFAVPFLIAPLRHWLFGRAKNNPNSMFRRFVKRGQGYTYTYTRKTTKTPHSETTIEGEFKQIDKE